MPSSANGSPDGHGGRTARHSPQKSEGAGGGAGPAPHAQQGMEAEVALEVARRSAAAASRRIGSPRRVCARAAPMATPHAGSEPPARPPPAPPPPLPDGGRGRQVPQGDVRQAVAHRRCQGGRLEVAHRRQPGVRRIGGGQGVEARGAPRRGARAARGGSGACGLERARSRARRARVVDLGRRGAALGAAAARPRRPPPPPQPSDPGPRPQRDPRRHRRRGQQIL